MRILTGSRRTASTRYDCRLDGEASSHHYIPSISLHVCVAYLYMCTHGRWNILGGLGALPDVGTGPAWVRYGNPPSPSSPARSPPLANALIGNLRTSRLYKSYTGRKTLLIHRYPPALNTSLDAIDYVMDRAHARGMTVRPRHISRRISLGEYLSANSGVNSPIGAV